MWAPLDSSEIVERYAEYRDPDWSPMTRVLGALVLRPYAGHLFAFTSLDHFVITTAPTYEESFQGHSLIAGLEFRPEPRLFEVGYGELRGVRWAVVRRCEESEVLRLLDCVVLAWDIGVRLR